MPRTSPTSQAYPSPLRALTALTTLVAAARAAPTAELVWQQSEASAVYTTASIVRHASGAPSFVAATWLTTPVLVEAYNTSDTGGALWAFEGCGHADSAFWATTARHAERPAPGAARVDTLAVETEALPPAGVVVRAFDSQAAGGAPVWAYNVSRSAQPASIDMSDDGSTAAFSGWLWDASGNISSWLLVWDAQTGKLRFSLQEPLARGGPCTLSGSGAWVAWTQGDSIAVVDGATGAQRGSALPMGWNTEAQISDDGNTVAFAGQQEAQIWRWNASAADWSLAHRIQPPDEAAWFSDSSALASNSAAFGDVAAFGFLGAGELQARVLVYAASGARSGQLLVDYTTPKNVKLQTNTYLRVDGDFVGVALWGDQGDFPTVVLLKAGAGDKPLFSFVTPGSMMGVDVAMGAAAGEVFIAAAGKHVPANTYGNGGDAYTWRITGA